MKMVHRVTITLVCTIGLAAGVSHGQSNPEPRAISNELTCSPAPCALPPTQVSEGGALVNTPSIAADPLNSRHLLLGANDFNCGDSASYSSQDGGTTWMGPFCMPNLDDGGRLFRASIDPGVTYDRTRMAYIAAPYFYTQGSNTTGFVGFSSSPDGVTWAQPAVALKVAKSFPAYSWFAADTSVGSPYLNNLYASAVAIGPPGDQSENEVVVAHSNDGGATWHNAPVDPLQFDPAVDNFTNMAVGKDGTVYIAWLHCPKDGKDAHCDDGSAYMVFSKSTNGGATWSVPSLIREVNMPFNWTLPNSSVRVYNYPVLGVDNGSGQYTGCIYVVMYSWTGAYLRVAVIRSTDGGQTWSKPVPVAPPTANHDQFFPWLSVSPTGLVGVSWLDRRNDPANVKYQAFAAISRDGGKTFQPNVQLTSAFSDPDVNGYPGGGWMGDYTGNAWAGPNNFLAAWMDSSNGVDMQVMVGGIRVK